MPEPDHRHRRHVRRRRWGLTFASGSAGSTVQGLIISNFSGGAGITLNSNDVTVQANWIGTDSTGSVAEPDAVGIAITGTGNTIGGALAADANVISGNSDAGVTDDGGSSPDNVVLNNLIGVNAGSMRIFLTEPGHS